MRHTHLRQLMLCICWFYLLEAANSAIPRYAKAAGLLQQHKVELVRPAVDNWNTTPDRRHRREANDFDDYEYDENADIIPNLEFPKEHKRLEDRLQEQATQIAESFKKMWESFGETMRHIAEGFQQMFGDSNTAPTTYEYTTPRNDKLLKNYESQW